MAITPNVDPLLAMLIKVGEWVYDAVTSEDKDPVAPKRGDVICARRMFGLYDHYGIYENDGSVYEYAGLDDDFDDVKVRRTTLQKFIGDSEDVFVLDFPETYGRPAKAPMLTGAGSSCIGLPDLDLGLLEEKMRRYRVNGPDETISRAKSRLGESRYNLFTNNCEHFALWCKTNISESHQVDDVDKLLSILAQRRPLPPGCVR